MSDKKNEERKLSITSHVSPAIGQDLLVTDCEIDIGPRQIVGRLGAVIYFLSSSAVDRSFGVGGCLHCVNLTHGRLRMKKL